VAALSLNARSLPVERAKLGQALLSFLLIQADVAASSADALANDLVIRLRHVETSAAHALHPSFLQARTLVT
jgi:hypothetical protein